jgi:hypothetical protein
LDKRYQVFFSSTFADLENERKKVIETLMNMDCIPAGMELFPATDEEQFEFIKHVINDCDYYLLIIGGRYGSLTQNGISYTEQEYDYALEQKLKVIALLHKNPQEISFEKSEQNPDLRDRLQTFRDKVARGRIVKFWQNVDDLPGIVALSLTNAIKMFPAVGWVRANKVSNEDLLIEINELRKQNGELKNALSNIEPNIFTGSEEKDFSYIYSQLNRFEDVKVEITEKEKKSIEMYSINLASLIPFISTPEFDKWLLSSILKRELFNTNIGANLNIFATFSKKIDEELLMYGLLVREFIPPRSINSSSHPAFIGLINRGQYSLFFSEKFHRFKYWLSKNDMFSEQVMYKKIESTQLN